jgi:D-alanine-D-alanine ligase
MKTLPKKITVIYNSVDESSPIIPPDRREADQDTIRMARDISNALSWTFNVEMLEIPFENPKLAGKIKTDLVFNLCEGVGYDYACKVIQAMDKADIPFIGAGSTNYRIGSDKALLKEYLNKVGILTPYGQFFENPDTTINPRLKFPLIVKPDLEHGSVGITQESVVTNEKELKTRVTYVLDTYKEGVVAEEYIEGREMQLTLVGNGKNILMLPIKEILFVNGMAEKWHVVTFSAKWEEGSSDDRGTPSVCPVGGINKEEEQYFLNFGHEIYTKTECQDYSRIDLRYVQKERKAYVLDVNPNPDLSPDAGIAKAASVYGWDYRKLLSEIVRVAWERVGVHNDKQIG